MSDLVVKDALELDTREVIDPLLYLGMRPRLVRERIGIFTVSADDAGVP